MMIPCAPLNRYPVFYRPFLRLPLPQRIQDQNGKATHHFRSKSVDQIPKKENSIKFNLCLLGQLLEYNLGG